MSRCCGLWKGIGGEILTSFSQIHSVSGVGKGGGGGSEKGVRKEASLLEWGQSWAVVVIEETSRPLGTPLSFTDAVNLTKELAFGTLFFATVF